MHWKVQVAKELYNVWFWLLNQTLTHTLSSPRNLPSFSEPSGYFEYILSYNQTLGQWFPYTFFFSMISCVPDIQFIMHNKLKEQSLLLSGRRISADGSFSLSLSLALYQLVSLFLCVRILYFFYQNQIKGNTHQFGSLYIITRNDMWNEHSSHINKLHRIRSVITGIIKSSIIS